MTFHLRDYIDGFSAIFALIISGAITAAIQEGLDAELYVSRGKVAMGGEIFCYIAVFAICGFVLFQLIQIILHKISKYF